MTKEGRALLACLDDARTALIDAAVHVDQRQRDLPKNHPNQLELRRFKQENPYWVAALNRYITALKGDAAS